MNKPSQSKYICNTQLAFQLLQLTRLQKFLSAESRDDVTESEQACWTLELHTNCDSLH